MSKCLMTRVTWRMKFTRIKRRRGATSKSCLLPVLSLAGCGGIPCFSYHRFRNPWCDSCARLWSRSTDVVVSDTLSSRMSIRRNPGYSQIAVLKYAQTAGPRGRQHCPWSCANARVNHREAIHVFDPSHPITGIPRNTLQRQTCSYGTTMSQGSHASVRTQYWQLKSLVAR